MRPDEYPESGLDLGYPEPGAWSQWYWRLWSNVSWFFRTLPCQFGRHRLYKTWVWENRRDNLEVEREYCERCDVSFDTGRTRRIPLRFDFENRRLVPCPEARRLFEKESP